MFAVHCGFYGQRPGQSPVPHGCVMRAKWVKSALVLAAALSLGACGLAKLAYQQADWLFTDRVAELAGIEGDARSALQQRVAKVHQWHRTNELPAYAKLMDDVVVAVDRGMSKTDAAALYERGRGYYRELAAELVMAAGPTLSSLSPEQVIVFEDNLETDNESYKERFAAATLEARREARRERVLERVEQFVDDISESQREMVFKYSDAFPDSGPLWYDYRLAQQIRVLRVLREQQGEQAVLDTLRRWYVEGADRGPRLQAMTVQLEDNLAAMVAGLVASLSAEQRAGLKETLSDYATLARELAAGD